MFMRKNMITLTSKDGKAFKVEKPVAMEMVTIRSFLEMVDDNSEQTIPVSEVNSELLEMIINFLTKYLELKDSKVTKENLDNFCKQFVKDIDIDDLLPGIMATNYLEVKELQNRLSQEVADRIHNKSVNFVRKFFGIESDLTPEEEAKLHQEHSWAYEGVDED